MGKKKTSWWSNFKFWLFLKNMVIILKYYDLRTKILKVLHCKKGFHFLLRDGIKVSVSGAGYSKGWSRSTTFFKCKVCDTIYFPTKKDQLNYDFIKKREEKSMVGLVNSMVKDIKKKHETHNNHTKRK